MKGNAPSSRYCADNISTTRSSSSADMRETVKSWRETHHAADAGFAFRDNQPILIYAAIWGIWQQGWVVIVEHKRVAVIGIANSGGTQVSRTHVASGIVSR